MGAYTASDERQAQISGLATVTRKDCAKGCLSIEKLVLVCGRAVISRRERNVGTHVDNRLPSVMHYPDIQ